MLKKIITFLLLVNTLSAADMKEKAFLVGLDIKHTNIETRYETTGQFAYPKFKDSGTKIVPALKLGYQYYFTRVYLNYSQLDEKYDAYNVKSEFYDVNFEYVPVFYKGCDYQLRGLFGVSIGYNYTEMYDLKRGLLDQHQVSLLEDYKQEHIMYGFQVGGVYEFDFGLSIDLGIRFREGDYIQMQEETQQMSIKTDRQEYYAGFNYLF